MPSKNSCHVSKCPCVFRLIAGQVTQQYKWHALSGDICISFILWMLSRRFSFLPPNSLSFSLVFPPLFSIYDTSVSDTSVSWTSVHLHLRCLLQVNPFQLQATLEVSRLYSQTHSLEARLWQSEVTANSPLSKRERCFACFVSFRNSTLFTHGS